MCLQIPEKKPHNNTEDPIFEHHTQNVGISQVSSHPHTHRQLLQVWGVQDPTENAKPELKLFANLNIYYCNS